MDIKISTQNYEVISSGSIIVPSGEFVEFQIETLKFRIQFEQEPNDSNGNAQPGRINAHLVGTGEDAYMLITFYNQNSALFSSMSDFANLGIVHNRNLSLKFAIVSINNGQDMLFHYTWFHNLTPQAPNTIINSTITE